LAFGFTNITDACGTCRQKHDYRELELSSFAVTKLAEMLRDFKCRYYKRWEGELVGAS